jgi:hypothetical protein
MIARSNTSWSDNQFAGYLDDLRITKGVARYTESFLPPQEPSPHLVQTYTRNNALIYDYVTPVE